MAGIQRSTIPYEASITSPTAPPLLTAQGFSPFGPMFPARARRIIRSLWLDKRFDFLFRRLAVCRNIADRAELKNKLVSTSHIPPAPLSQMTAALYDAGRVGFGTRRIEGPCYYMTSCIKTLSTATTFASKVLTNRLSRSDRI